MTTRSRERWSLYWQAENRPYKLVLASGILLGLSFPPSPLNFLIFVAFIPLFILVEVTRERVFEDILTVPLKAAVLILWRLLTLQFIWRKNVFRYDRKIISGNAQVFRYTYLAFLIWNFMTCYWLMLTALSAPGIGEAIQSMVAGLMAVILNPFLMAVPYQAYSRLGKIMHPVAAAFALIPFWIAFEYLHLNWELTWSWLNLGHALTYWPSLLQYIEFTGTLGASVYILTANICIYALYRSWNFTKRFHYGWMAATAIWIMLPLMLNPLILNPERKVFQPTGSITVRVIQPNIDPYVKFANYTREDQIRTFSELITAPGIDSIDLVVLPETAIPKGLWTSEIAEEKLLDPLWDIVREHELAILTGITEYRFFPSDTKDLPVSAEPMGVRGYYDACNSAVILKAGGPSRTYQKSKLVPMVERMPFLETLGFLKEYNIDLGGGFGNYGMPDSIINLHPSDSLAVGVMICYESEFGEMVTEFTSKGAQLLTIITNDGWWRQSSGYIQHAHFSVLRSIENRRDIARSANTGRSLFTNSKGEILSYTNWWEPAWLDARLNLYNEQTFYVKHGDYIGRMALIFSLILVVGGIFYYVWRKRKPEIQ